MRKNCLIRRITAVLCALALALTGTAASAGGATPPAEGEAVRFLPYDEAVEYFDLDKAAANWCMNFGLDPNTQLDEARRAILAGTDPRLIVGLATFARDTGHGDEKLVVSNAFRPACYQEVIGLHDGNANTGPFRKALKWNGRSVTDFWWTAEEEPDWPDAYTIDLRAYDLSKLDLRYYYRAALRLWDNTWISSYYAKPGCSAHNSGTALDLTNYWIATNFDTVYTYNDVEYDMADYGLYKPLQPSPYSKGEEWHITCSPAVYALGNYDGALKAGYEIVYGLYYNPTTRGWDYADGRGIYVGAGVVLIQIQLCRLGLLEQKYITGFFCLRTEEAVRAFQARQGMDADGVCGAGTLERLFAGTEVTSPGDTIAPVLTAAAVTEENVKGFTLQVTGRDETRLNAFRVDTRENDSDVWVSRYYNAPESGTAALTVDVWEQGTYEIRAAAVDAAGNESPLTDIGGVFVDVTPPVLRELRISNVTETTFDLSCRAEDNGTLLGFRVTLQEEGGEQRESFLLSGSSGLALWTSDPIESGTWTITVTAEDVMGNSASYTFSWRFTPGEARPGMQVIRYGAG